MRITILTLLLAGCATKAPWVHKPNECARIANTQAYAPRTVHVRLLYYSPVMYQWFAKDMNDHPWSFATDEIMHKEPCF